MNEENPFKKIETNISLPKELKEDIIQELEEIVEEAEETTDTQSEKS